MKYLFTLAFLILLSVSGFSQQIESIKTVYGYSGPWENVNLHSFTYDANGRVSSKLEQEWDIPTASRKNYLWINYTYNPNELLQQHILQNWNGNPAAWKNGQRYIPTYNSAGQLESYTVELWTGAAFENYLLVENTYDSNGFLINFHSKEWSSGRPTFRRAS